MKKIFHHKNKEGKRIALTVGIAFVVYILFTFIPSISFFFVYLGSFLSNDDTYASWSEMSLSLDEIRARALLVPDLEMENAFLRQSMAFNDMSQDKELLLVTAVPGTMAYDEQQIRLRDVAPPLGSFVYSQKGTPLGTLDRISGSSGVVSWWSTPGSAVSVRFATSTELFSAKGQGGGILLSEVPRGIVSLKELDPVYVATDPLRPIGYVSHITDEPRDPFVRLTISMAESIWQVQYVYIGNE